MTMNDEREAMDAASKAMARRVGVNQIELTLSNGIVLEYKPIPPILTNRVRAEQERKWPAPPMVFVEDKGREEENPNDPEYQRALVRQMDQDNLAIEDLMVAAGVEVKHVPEGRFGPDDLQWLKDARAMAAIAFLGEDVAEDAVKRKIAWVRFYALETYQDLRLHTEMSMEIQLVREEAVQEAMAGFRGLPQPGSDLGTPAAAPNNNGNRNRAERRRSARV